VSFRFRLQRVLELREEAEQACAQALADAERRAEAARHARDALTALHASAHAELADARHQAPRVGHLQPLGLTLAAMRDRIEAADEAVAAADAAVADARAALVEAARERRALERLRERHEAEWRAGEAQADRQRMDEIALARHVAGGRGTPPHPSVTPSRA
jgi:flagellar export protein FliJ